MMGNLQVYETTYDLGKEDNYRGQLSDGKVNSDFDQIVYVLLELL